MLKKLLVCAVLGMSTVVLPAQDVHFTQFTMSPLMLNPANTGAFFGSYRIGGIYRDQWAHLSNSFQTPALYVDAPIIRGFRKTDWVGVGVNFFQDKAGIAGLQFSGLQMSAAYHLSLNKKRSSVLTFGFGGGSMNRRINLNSDKIKLYDELEDPNVQSQDRMSIQEKTDYIDLHAGLLFTHHTKAGNALHIGVALNHLNKPDYKLRGGNGDADKLPMRISGSVDMEFPLADKWSLTPAILVQNMTNIQEIQAQALAGYLFNEEKQITLLGGLGYRLGDAIPVIVGAQWKSLRVGVSWDYNTSDVTPNGNGGFEIAASYIGRIFKKPTVKRVIICPRY
ncbi:MAG: PorP/SprF family type IX secretion system membrane protein [Saprospiraceae bacterium]|nr:PorP/SprF family type IX secretion system membrane protein [Saprospiraceae bacterium]